MSKVSAILPCLPTQQKFVDSTHKHPMFIAGLGCGKSSGIAKRALKLIGERSKQGVKAFIFIASLTQSLANDTIVPELQEHLDHYNIRYRWNSSQSIRKFTVWFGKRKHTIKIISMDNPATAFIGYNATDGILDEFDVLPEHKKREAWDKALGRIRKKFFLRNSKGEYRRARNGKRIAGMPTLAVATTPEYKGFTEYLCIRSAYEDKNGEKLDEIREPIGEYLRGETAENPYLSDDYLDSLRENLDPRRFRAYTQGYFENFQGDRVWEYFNVDQHVSSKLTPGTGTAFSMWDFGWNDYMYVAIGTVFPNGDVRIIAEHQARKTLLEDFILKYKQLCEEHHVFPLFDYVDPAGGQHHEQTGSTNIREMEFHGLRPRWVTSRIVEGIIIGNNLLHKNKIMVHDRCKKMIDALQNDSYPEEKNGKRLETPVHGIHESCTAALRYLCVNEFRNTHQFWNSRIIRTKS